MSRHAGAEHETGISGFLHQWEFWIAVVKGCDGLCIGEFKGESTMENFSIHVLLIEKIFGE